MKPMKKAFTLIELMIVVAIIAIIAAIAIPNLIAAKMSANETAAIGSLNAIKNAETLFSERDIDGDGSANYWAFNVFGLYAIQNANNQAIKLIQDPATANSDLGPALPGAAPATVTYDATLTVPTSAAATIVPKQGYYITAQTEADDGVAATNFDGVTDPTSEYYYLAAPNSYNRDGVKTFMVSNAGVVYQGDTGAGFGGTMSAAAVTAYLAAAATWPGENPNTTAVPGGTGANWQVAK